jgi:hypothetical protein
VVLSGARTAHAGAAAGVLTTSQQFSSAAGVAAIGTVFFAVLGAGVGVASYTIALSWVAVIDLVLAGLACLTSLRLRPPAVS